MAKMNITLKASLKRGTFYWVTEVEANSEEEAVQSAENLFLAEVENANEWEFNEFEVTG
jgi:hypothetical protein